MMDSAGNTYHKIASEPNFSSFYSDLWYTYVTTGGSVTTTVTWGTSQTTSVAIAQSQATRWIDNHGRWHGQSQPPVQELRYRFRLLPQLESTWRSWWRTWGVLGSIGCSHGWIGMDTQTA